MAAAKGGKNVVKKGKKPHKNKPTGKKYQFYTITGDEAKVTRKHCPRCGPGTFLADHKTRLYCGNCHYTEFLERAAK